MTIHWICLASFLMGIFGSFTSLLTGVLAYIGAATDVASRTTRMSILLSMSFVAGTLGPFLSGILATQISPLFVFIVIGVCHLLAAIYTVTFVKNVKGEGESEWKLTEMFSTKHLRESWNTCFVEREQQEKKKLLVLLAMAVVVMIVSSGISHNLPNTM